MSPVRSTQSSAPYGATAGDYRYADHPPAIYSATALAQWLVPDDELGARLLVFVASILAAVILFLLLCELGLAPVLAAASVGIGLSVPMFLTYGTMLDTLMLGLPFAAGYLLVVATEPQRSHELRRPRRTARRRSVSSRGKASSSLPRRRSSWSSCAAIVNASERSLLPAAAPRRPSL